jgi:hypothetical protein
VSFEPFYMNAMKQFDAAGEEQPLGVNLTFDSAGVNFFPSLQPTEDAIRAILDDPTYRINAGFFETIREADVRRYPFNFQLGLSDRLTIAASLPVVTTRSQVAFTVDSTTSEMGWNPAATDVGRQEVASLIGELGSSASALESIISGGGLDCPTGPQCNSARDLVTRARSFRDNLVLMTGVFGDGTLVTALPPFAPLASSGAGSSILALIQGFSTDLQSFGAPALAATLPLPGDAIGTSAIDSVLTDPLFGYDADPLGFVKYKEKLGDIELGLRWGLAQGQSMRAVLSTIVRLPTGFRDEPGNFTDIGTGDRQTDLQVGLDAAFEPGSIVSLALTGYYNLQLGDQLPRRVTSHERPIRVAAYELNVSRNLGDAYRIAAFPAVRLAPGFAAYGSIDYYHKGSDKYSFVGAPSPSSTGPAVQDLEFETGMTQLNVGGGIHYRSTGRRPGSLPVEAGVLYQVSHQGSGGQTQKVRGINFYLRLFFRLFGGPEEVPVEEPAEEAAEVVPPGT